MTVEYFLSDIISMQYSIKYPPFMICIFGAVSFSPKIGLYFKVEQQTTYSVTGELLLFNSLEERGEDRPAKFEV